MSSTLKAGPVYCGDSCGLCRRAYSDGAIINVLVKGEAVEKIVCISCRKTREFMFVDDAGFVRYNLIEAEYRSILSP